MRQIFMVGYLSPLVIAVNNSSSVRKSFRVFDRAIKNSVSIVGPPCIVRVCLFRVRVFGIGFLQIQVRLAHFAALVCSHR